MSARYLLVLLVLLVLLGALPAHALRCGTNLIQEGDTIAELFAVCGEPRLRWRQTIVFRIEQPPFAREQYIDQEIWLYVPGSSDFVQVVTIEDGEVVRIEHGRRGREYGGHREACESPSFGPQPGTWAPEVVLFCGPPDERRLIERRALPVAGSAQLAIVRQVDVEEWRYYFPAQRAYASLKFENGRLVWLSLKQLRDKDWPVR
ncbi:MAG TPA: DUF2845 domain-containing protein [Candidatus Competibacteraceae bacterium]|nr:DUF2845 domain-containing protein [Candidatus Competibacteraceae bacterium]